MNNSKNEIKKQIQIYEKYKQSAHKRKEYDVEKYYSKILTKLRYKK